VLALYRKHLGAAERWSMGFVQATALPLLVVITEIGLDTERMQPSTAAALVGAGMLSVLVFPLTGFGILDRARARGDTEPGEEPADEPVEPMLDDEAPFDER
jgi:hypothetical protein